MEIDSLELRVKSQATSAIASLENLEKKLLLVSKTMANVNGSGLQSMANGIMTLGQAVNQVKSIDSRSFSTLANNINKLSQANYSGLRKSASSISSMVGSISQLQGASKGISDIGELSASIRKLGSKSIDKAIDNMPKLATAMNQLMTSLSNAPQVSRNLIEMTNALANFSQSSGRISQITSQSKTTFSNFASNANAAQKSFKGFAYYFGKFYASYFLAIRAFRKIGDAIKLSSALTEVQNVVTMTFGQMTDMVEEFSKSSIKNFGLAELSAKQYASRFQAMGSAMGLSLSGMGDKFEFINNKMNGMSESVKSLYSNTNGLSDMSINLTKLTADMASFYNVEQDVVAQDMEAIFTGMTRPLRKYGLDLTQATLQEWAMNNGLDANMKTMSQAEKTMLRYQYVMANADKAMGDFSKTSHTWANNTRMLRQNIQALGATWGTAFINMLNPLITTLNRGMIAITAFSENVVNALGHIFGWKIQIQNVGISQDFEDTSDALEDATGNAKKLKNILLGFDELNILGDNDKSGGSGSGITGGGSSQGNGFQIVETESIFKSQVDNLEELGEMLNQKLRNVLEGIEWDDVYQGARNFGKGLADFLNGLISPELFGDVGKTIAGSLNTAIYASLSFAETFDFAELGVSLATAINDFFTTFDFKSLAKSMNKWVDGLETTLGQFLRTLSWSDVIKASGDFLSEIEIDTIGVIVGIMTIKRVGKVAIGKAIGYLISKKLSTFFASAFGGITIKEIGINILSVLPTFQGTAGFDVIAGKIVGELDNAITRLFPDVAKFFGDFLFGAVVAGVATAGNPIAMAIGGLFTSFPIKINWFGEGGVFSFEWTFEWFDKAKEAFKKAFDGNQPDIMSIGGWILEGILDGFVGAFSFIGEPIAKFFQSIWQGLCSIFGIHSPAREMKPIGENILLGILNGFRDRFPSFNDVISSFKRSVIDSFSSMKEKVQGIFKGWNIPTPSFGSFLNSVVSAKNSVISYFSSMKTNVFNALSNWHLPTPSIKIPHISVNWETGGIVAKALQAVGLKGLPTFNVAYYKDGGFPEDGWFRASHGEMIGKFDNGQSVVANNMQITEGIKKAVIEGMMQVQMATSNSRSQNVVVENVIKCGPETLYKLTQQGKRAYEDRYHTVVTI